MFSMDSLRLRARAITVTLSFFAEKRLVFVSLGVKTWFESALAQSITQIGHTNHQCPCAESGQCNDYGEV